MPDLIMYDIESDTALHVFTDRLNEFLLGTEHYLLSLSDDESMMYYVLNVLTYDKN